MKTWAFLIALALAVCCVTNVSARRAHLSPDQRDQLAKAQTVGVKVLALTEQGKTDSSSLEEIVTERLAEVGYSTTTDLTQPSDVQFNVKCEERKTWAGTTAAGGDAELADAPARLWKGPACLFSYSLQGKNFGWYKEIRTDFENALDAAKQANASDSGAFALKQLQEKLLQYDFPIYVTAEWRQIDRLLKMLESPQTPKLRKVTILSVLSQIESEEALPELTQMMKDKDLAEEAILALVGTGGNAIPVLIDLFTHSKQSQIQAAAAKGLGEVAARTGDPRTIPPLVAYLEDSLKTMESSEDINFPVLTQVVWAIGKLRDDQSMAPMAELNQKVWLIYDNSEEMTELREATNWTYKQLDLDGHVS